MGEMSRRDAMKLTAAGAAALAATNVLSSGNPIKGASADALVLQRSALSGKTVQLGFGPGVTRESIHAALDTLFEISGCLACGLLGYDLHLYGVNPDPVVAEIIAAEKFEGVHYVDIRAKVAP